MLILRMPILANNKKAQFDFEFIKKYEAGIILQGPEVKSAKSGGITLAGSYVGIKANDLLAYGLKIARYKKAAISPDPDREKKLLLTNKEANEIRQYLSQKGLTIIPTSIYTKNGLIKVELAVAKGRKKVDKRERIKERDVVRRLRGPYGDDA